jgi:hypothetical protein
MRLLQRIKSVQFILAFWYSALLLVALVLLGGSVYVYLQHLQETQLDQNLNEEVDWISHRS